MAEHDLGLTFREKAWDPGGSVKQIPAGIDIQEFLTGLCLHSGIKPLVKYILTSIAHGFGFTDPMLIAVDGENYLIKRFIDGELAEEIIADDRKRSLIKFVSRERQPVNKFDYSKGRLLSSVHLPYDDIYAFSGIVPLSSLQRTSGFLLFNHPTNRKPLNPENLAFFKQVMIPLGLALDVALMLHTKGKLDPETGLYNKTTFFDEFSQALRRASMTGQPLTLGILEFQDFIGLADTQGADSVMELEVLDGNQLRSITRANDLIFRFGNGRFVLILAETSKSLGEAVALASCLGGTDCYRVCRISHGRGYYGPAVRGSGRETALASVFSNVKSPLAAYFNLQAKRKMEETKDN